MYALLPFHGRVLSNALGATTLLQLLRYREREREKKRNCLEAKTLLCAFMRLFCLCCHVFPFSENITGGIQDDKKIYYNRLDHC